MDQQRADNIIQFGLQRVSETTDFYALGDLEIEFENALPALDSAEFSSLRAEIMRRRGEWEKAGRFLASEFARFPDAIDLAYESALCLIDANCYALAVELLENLASVIPRLSDRHLRSLWRASSLTGMHSIAKRAYTEASGRDAFQGTPKLGERIETAIAIQAGLADHPVRLVSLGDNCLPWMVGNRWGLRLNPADLHEENPFNLAQCAAHSSAAIIASYGSDLLNPTQLELIPTDNRIPMPINRALGFQFNHERGDAWGKNDFQPLRHRYAPRLSMFISAFSGAPRLFIYYAELGQNLDALAVALENANRDSAFRLLIVDPQPVATPPHQRPWLSYLASPLPHPNYVWFIPDELESDAGIEFERKIASAVLTNMQQLRMMG